MKVVFLTRRFWPDIGGVEKHVEFISQSLIKQKNKITVITENPGNLKSHEFAKRIEIFRIPIRNEFNKKWGIWFWLLRNRNLISQSDIVHVHDVSFWYFPFKFIYPRKKFYITFHGYSSFPFKKRELYLRKLSEKLSSGNISVGTFIKKWFGTKSDFVTFGGVNLPRKQSDIVNKKSVLFVGRLVEQTGIHIYADAVRRLRTKIRDFNFTVVGEGEYKKILSDFNIVGEQENTQKYYDNTNFVFASGYLSILEGMANRRLVFAVYDNELRKDYYRMTPFWRFMILSSDSQDLANKLDYYLKNQKEAQEIINEAYNWVSNNTWETVADLYLKLWQKK